MAKRKSGVEWWTPTRTEAAVLCAEGLGPTAVGAEVGVSAATIQEWLHRDEFKSRIASIQMEIDRQILNSGIARRTVRIKALQEQFDRLSHIIECRSRNSSAYPDEEGGRSGLLTHTIKGIGKGEDFEIVHEYRADTALSAERRAILQQAAVEVGEWQEKIDVRLLSDDQLLALVQRLDLDV